MRLLNPVALLGRTPKARKLIAFGLVAVLTAVVLQILVKNLSPPPPQSQSFAPLTTIPDQAEVVETGFFLMNMYDLDTASNTYYADFYAWFKWRGELDPLAHTDSRIALPVTALLTAVFLQDAYSSTLPEIGYLVLMDKIYVIAYILIFVSIVEAIITADWIKDDQPEMYSRVVQIDRLLLALQMIAILVGALGLILMS